MGKTIDMQLMRYINLFARVSRVSTTDCFVYNDTIYFAVPKKMMSEAIGKSASNVKTLSETLRRRIRVISAPKKEFFDKADNSEKEKIIEEFIREIVAPVEFTSFNFIEGVATVSGTRESKAMMIGRDRAREKELNEILERTFGVKEFKVI